MKELMVATKELMVVTKVRTLMVKNLEMTSAHGKTGASGLVLAVHSLADALAAKLVRGPLTTSCSTLAAVDSSAQDGKLKPGPAKPQTANRPPLRHQRHASGETGVGGPAPAAPSLAGGLAGRLAPGGRPTTVHSTDSAAASSARECRLKTGAAETTSLDLCFKIAKTSFAMCHKIHKKVKQKSHVNEVL